MTKDTHLATGLALSTALLMPHNFHSFVYCMCGAAIGSTISDIDVGSSKPRKELNKIIAISIGSFVSLLIIDYIFKINIFSIIQSQEHFYQFCFGFVTFLALSIYGSTTNHRSFTHSIIGLIAFTGAAWITYSALALPFLIGMISHILLDTLNTKKVRLLYPSKKGGVAFKLCHSDGKVDKFIQLIATLILIAEILIFFNKIIY